MIQRRHCYHDDLRRFYESFIHGIAAGQYSPVVEELSIETAKTLHSDRVYDCAMYTRLEELITWGSMDSWQIGDRYKIDDLYNDRINCYHGDDYWESCSHCLNGRIGGAKKKEEEVTKTQETKEEEEDSRV
jgi:hypothetical protein